MGLRYLRLMLRAALLLLPLLATHSSADIYTLDAKATSVAFKATAEGLRVTGTLPVEEGDVTVDLDAVAQSQIDVTVSTTELRTGFALITAVVKSAALLDAARHPRMRFVARRITRVGNTAEVEGALTIRGITRPVTLNAVFMRTPGSDLADLTRVGVKLTGSVNRRDFGITGYPTLVDDRIGIDIIAWMDRVDD